MDPLSALASVLAAEGVSIALGKAGVSIHDWLSGTDVQRAIEATDTHFQTRDIENVASNLRTWLSGPDFVRLLADLEQHGHSAAADLEATLGSMDALAYMGDAKASRALSIEIVTHFFQRYHDELTRSDDGTVHLKRYLAAKVEAVGADVSRLQATFDKIVTDPVQFTSRVVGPQLVSESGDYELCEVRGLIQSNRPLAALSWLQQAASQRSLADTVAKRYELHSQTGLAMLHLSRYEEAREQFQIARALRPERANAIANVALLEFICGDSERARQCAESALSVEEQNPTALKTLVQILARRGDLKAALAAANRLADEPTRMHLRGIAHLNCGDASSAATELRAALALDSDNLAIMIDAATAEFFSETQRVRSHDAAPWQNADGINDGGAAWALVTLDSALHRLRQGDNQLRVGEALMLRSCICALRDDDSAIANYREARSFGAHNQNATNAVCALLAVRGRNAEALECLESAGRGDGSACEFLIAQAVLMARGGDMGGARDVLQRVPPHDGAARRAQKIAECDIALMVDDLEGCETAIAALMEEPLQWDVAIRIAELQARRGSVVDAVATLDDAIARDAGGNKWRMYIAKADLLLKHQRWSEAADALGYVVDENAPEEFIRMFLMALRNSYDVEGCLSFARRVKAHRGAIANCVETEAEMLMYLNRLSEAESSIAEVLESDKDNVRWQLELAVIAARQGRGKDALAILPDANDVRRLGVMSAMRAASIRCENGDGCGALETAFQCRVAFPDDPDAHLMYCGLFMRIEQRYDLPLNCDVADVGTVVFLSVGEEREECYIASHPDEAWAGQMVTADGPLGGLLMGRARGDSVVLLDGPITSRVAHIDDLVSKYVYVYRDTMQRFNTIFPGDARLIRVPITADNMSPILAAVDLRHAQATKLMQFYQDFPVPLSTVAEAAGISDVNAWYAAVSGELGRVYVREPGEVRGHFVKLIAGGAPAVLETTAICAMIELEILTLVPSLNLQLIVSQLTLDRLEMSRQEMDLRSDFTIARHEGGYVRQASGASGRDRARSAVTDALHLLRSRCTICGVAPAYARRWRELAHATSDAASASVFLAAETGGMLVTEDLRLRTLARGECKVVGVPSVGILEELWQRNLIEECDFVGKLLLTASWGYHFTSIDAAICLEAARQDAYMPGEMFGRALRLLGADDTSRESVVGVIAGFLVGLWSVPGVSEVRRTALFVASMEVLARKDGWGASRDLLLRLLQTGLRLRPIELLEIERRIAHFSKALNR